jgi:hypothetical protein
VQISELSRVTGVPVATIKYYLREGLLPAGTATSATRATYGERHVERLRLIRALVEVGRLPIARVRAVVACVESPPSSWHELLGAVHGALGPAGSTRGGSAGDRGADVAGIRVGDGAVGDAGDEAGDAAGDGAGDTGQAPTGDTGHAPAGDATGDTGHAPAGDATQARAGDAASAVQGATAALEAVRGLGWRVHPDAPALRELQRALDAVAAVGLPMTPERLSAYASAAAAVAEVDVASVPTDSPEHAARHVVVGTVLYEPVLLALRRLAQEDASARRFGS